MADNPQNVSDIMFMLGQISGTLHATSTKMDTFILEQHTANSMIEKRIGSLENSRARGTGVMAVVSFLISLVGAGLVTFAHKFFGG